MHSFTDLKCVILMALGEIKKSNNLSHWYQLKFAKILTVIYISLFEFNFVPFLKYCSAAEIFQVEKSQSLIPVEKLLPHSKSSGVSCLLILSSE